MTDEEASVPYEMVRVVAERFLRAMYGPRCTVFVKECVCCQRWHALDQLIENPFIKKLGKKGKKPKKKSYDALAIADYQKVESRRNYETKKDKTKPAKKAKGKAKKKQKKAKKK